MFVNPAYLAYPRSTTGSIPDEGERDPFGTGQAKALASTTFPKYTTTNVAIVEDPKLHFIFLLIFCCILVFGYCLIVKKLILGEKKKGKEENPPLK